MSPKRTTLETDCKPMIWILQANQKNNEYFDAEDMGRHPRLRKELILMSSAIISQVETKDFAAEFLSKVIMASKEALLYYKNRLYIPENDDLHTAIAKGCHDS